MKTRKTAQIQVSSNVSLKGNRFANSRVALIKWNEKSIRGAKMARDFHTFLLNNASGDFYSELERRFIESHEATK